MANRDKERDRLHGQLIMDFINAKDPDEACVVLITGIQRAFDLSPNFTEKAFEKFPPSSTIQKFLPMNNLDKILFDTLHERRRFDLIPPNFTEYDLQWKKKILKLSESFSEERFREIEEIVNHYSKMAEPLKFFDKTRQKIRNLIEDLLEGKNIFDNMWLRQFFVGGTKITKGPYLAISKTGSIYEKSIFSEMNFFAVRGYTYHVPKIYKDALAYVLIHFLKSSDNRALIRKCEKCQKFFIASKLDKRIKKCKDCSRKSTKSKEWNKEYMKEYREKKKRENAKHQIERKIENYMRNLSITREEALEIIKADSML